MYYKKIDGFEIRAFFVKESNELVNKVTYRRKALQTEILDDRLSKSYIGNRLILSDLKGVQQWAEMALKLLDKKDLSKDEKSILNSLFISMVTTYWKCFADTKGRHGVQLNKKYVPSTHTAIHEELRRIRHNFTAHCGDDPFESGYILYVKDVEGKERFEPFSLPIQRKANHGDRKLTRNIIDITSVLIEKLEEKQEKLLHKIEISAA